VTDGRAAALLAFWRDAGPGRWFTRDDAFDARLRDRFLPDHEAAARGALAAWEATPDGALALLLLLDQFPRNAFRGTPRMYATDPAALAAAGRALDAGHDGAAEAALRPFFYLPLMHAESLAEQERCVALAGPLGGATLRAAIEHRDIVRRFGRFPHRNAILGRATTEEEARFLEEGGFAG